MHWFYVEHSQITEKQIFITGEDVNHIKNVLRMGKGEKIVICDGQGKDYYCSISDMDKEQVFALSKQMMDGNKWDTFVLDLSFFLWDILGACTLGILNIFYVEPYRRLTRAGLYQALKEEQMFVRTENITDGQ